MRHAFITHRPDPRDLLRHGYLRVRIAPELLVLIEDIVSRARTFFRGAEAIKRRASLPGVREGWQPFGGEFSITPDRPDLHESFWVTLGRADEASSGYAHGAHALHAQMLVYLNIVQDIEALVMADLLAWLAPAHAPRMPARRSMESDLQILYYQPALEKRALLQDAHEDGLSLTFTWADRPGLELLGHDGLFHPVRLAPDELAILPGEILALMTGFKVRPQVHRVVRHRDQAERLTLSYFSSPDIVPDEQIEPWIRCTENRGGSLTELIRANRLKYLVA